MRVAALALLLVSIGCRRTSTEASVDAAPPVATAPVATSAADEAVDPFAPPPRELPAAEDNPSGGTATLEEPAKPTPAPTPAAPKVDPFDDAMNSVRSSAVGCFSTMPPGEYNATIAVNVTPTGTATRVEVVSGPADPAVRKCLESAATRSYPASEGGRKLSIAVQVKG
jgi:hypothetical protein